MTVSDDRATPLAEFRSWARTHIKGDEKGEAHLFLDRLFQAFGHPGIKEAGASLEVRVARPTPRHVAFADLVWKPIVLIEMKRRGEALARHYRQAFDYWTRLVPGRPRFVVLCNFDEFWIYDFETQMDVPLDKVRLEELPEKYGPLAFLFPTNNRPSFGNDHEAVTRAAADHLAECFNHVVRRVPRDLSQRFVLQMLVALFSEDIGLLPKYIVSRLLEDCKEPSDSYDLLGQLFTEMNTPGVTAGGRFKGVGYFNGGIFAVPARVELYPDEVSQLREAARSDWSQVRPEIFGTLFEHSLGKAQRHAFGAYFTTPGDIMKIVGPTIIEPWRERIECARTKRALIDLGERLRTFRVLDPACGSGNFLYIVYREIKRLEARIHERIREVAPSTPRAQLQLGFVTARNFFGIDVNPFAVELAKVTLMIARKLAIDELHITEAALPLDNIDANFMVQDALIHVDPQNPNAPRYDESGAPMLTKWPRADVIVGNPPFLGAKRLKPERGAEYVNAVRRAYPDVPGMADYCVYWFRRAHDHLPACTVEAPFGGRAGLVGTQNVRNNQSRVGGLDYITSTGTIVDAVDNQPWSGEAHVHVSIVNWVKTTDGVLLPERRRLWSSTPVSASGGGTSSLRDGAKKYDLRLTETSFISSALSDATDTSAKRPLACNKVPKRCFQGKIPGYQGFLLSADDVAALGLAASPVVVPYLTGRELLGDFQVKRWAIDFGAMTMLEAARHEVAFQRVKDEVLPAVQRAYDDAVAASSDMVAARREHLERWWQFWNRRDELRAALAGLRRYIGCSRVTRRPIMQFIESGLCPSDLVQVFAFEDDYSFGVLQSGFHFEWFKTSSRLKVESDLRYSVRDVFETFPWPQSPDRSAVRSVVRAAVELRRVRAEFVGDGKGGLRALYRTLDLPGANPLRDVHSALDEAVRQAYGFSTRSDWLKSLLDLNAAVATSIDRGELVTPPGAPASVGSEEVVVSTDFVAAAPRVGPHA